MTVEGLRQALNGLKPLLFNAVEGGLLSLHEAFHAPLFPRLGKGRETLGLDLGLAQIVTAWLDTEFSLEQELLRLDGHGQ
jgi:hypothetical protein